MHQLININYDRWGIPINTLTAIFIIIVVLGVVVSNIMLLKYSAKFSMKDKINLDPLEQAKQRAETIKQQQKDGKQQNNG